MTISGQNKKSVFRFPSLLWAIMCLSGCFSSPAVLSQDTWNYELFLNDIPAGSAVITAKKSGDTYITVTELIMKAGSVVNTSRQIVTETLEYVPVKLETYNRIIVNGKTQKIDTIAIFNGLTVELRTGSEKSTVELDREFRLDGRYLQSELLKRGFKKGLEIEYYVYEPSIEPESAVLMKTRVLGKETIAIEGRSIEAYRVVQYIERFKSFDMYLDNKAVLLKAELTMLNMNIRLVRKEN